MATKLSASLPYLRDLRISSSPVMHMSSRFDRIDARRGIMVVERVWARVQILWQGGDSRCLRTT